MHTCAVTINTIEDCKMHNHLASSPGPIFFAIIMYCGSNMMECTKIRRGIYCRVSCLLALAQRYNEASGVL